MVQLLKYRMKKIQKPKGLFLSISISISILLTTLPHHSWLTMSQAKEILRMTNSSSSIFLENPGTTMTAESKKNGDQEEFTFTTSVPETRTDLYETQTDIAPNFASEMTYGSTAAAAGAAPGVGIGEVEKKIKEELEFSSSSKYAHLKFGMKVSELKFPPPATPNEKNSESDFPDEDSELKFFQRIQGLNLGWEDILGSYRNVSAEVETALCKSKCKTTVALWVLQNLHPCALIEKRDCPKGLLCCIVDSAQTSSETRRSTQNPTKEFINPDDKGYGREDDIDNEDDLNPAPGIYVPFTLYNDDGSEQDIYYPEAILDPIPNDESSEIIKV